jgi:hypothetical protein
MSLSSAGILTVADDIIIGDGKTIGSASDPDAMSIASGGAVTFTQTPVFPDGSLALADLDIDGGTDIGAAIVDADLFIVDDGAGGTNRKTAASRLKTYVGANTPMVSADKTGGDLTINGGSYTKVTLNTERVDSNSAFASNTFTVPSGEGGKYFMSAHTRFNALNGASEYGLLQITNTDRSTVYQTNVQSGKTGYGFEAVSLSVIRSLSAGDTVSLYAFSSENVTLAENNTNLTIMRLIE